MSWLNDNFDSYMPKGVEDLGMKAKTGGLKQLMSTQRHSTGQDKTAQDVDGEVIYCKAGGLQSLTKISPIDRVFYVGVFD